MKSPCATCFHHMSGGDKNSDKCLNCKERIEFARRMDGVIAPTIRESLMVDTEVIPKRRGRPPGIKNKPKVEEAMPETKTCRECNETKPKTEFRRSNVSADGHDHICKKCLVSKYRKPKDSNVVRIDFGQHPEILNGLIEMAKMEFRTVEQQVLLFVSRGIEK